MRVVGLVSTSVGIADADDDPPARQVSIGLDVLEYFPAVTLDPTSKPREFGSPQQHTGITELDVLVPIRVLPWLRAVPLLGFTAQSFGFDANGYTAGQPALAEINQTAIVTARIPRHTSASRLDWRCPRWSMTTSIAWARASLRTLEVRKELEDQCFT